MIENITMSKQQEVVVSYQGEGGDCKTKPVNQVVKTVIVIEEMTTMNQEAGIVTVVTQITRLTSTPCWGISYEKR